MFIHEKYRGSGLGKKLLNDSVKWMKKTGCKVARLGVVAGNERTFPMYKGSGFDI